MAIDLFRSFDTTTHEPRTKIGAMGAAAQGQRSTMEGLGAIVMLGAPTVFFGLTGGPVAAAVGFALGGGMLYGIDSITR